MLEEWENDEDELEENVSVETEDDASNPEKVEIQSFNENKDRRQAGQTVEMEQSINEGSSEIFGHLKVENEIGSYVNDEEMPQSFAEQDSEMMETQTEEYMQNEYDKEQCCTNKVRDDLVTGTNSSVSLESQNLFNRESEEEQLNSNLQHSKEYQEINRLVDYEKSLYKDIAERMLNGLPAEVKEDNDKMEDMQNSEKLTNDTRCGDTEIGGISKSDNGKRPKYVRRKKRKYTRKRPKKMNFYEISIKNAKKYLEETDDALELGCSAMLALKTIRKSMVKNSNTYISKRIIELIAEEVIKDNIKRKFLKRYLNRLTSSEKADVSQYLSNDGVQSKNMIIESIETLLDTVDVDSE